MGSHMIDLGLWVKRQKVNVLIVLPARHRQPRCSPGSLFAAFGSEVDMYFLPA